MHQQKFGSFNFGVLFWVLTELRNLLNCGLSSKVGGSQMAPVKLVVLQKFCFYANFTHVARIL